MVSARRRPREREIRRRCEYRASFCGNPDVAEQGIRTPAWSFRVDVPFRRYGAGSKSALMAICPVVTFTCRCHVLNPLLAT